MHKVILSLTIFLSSILVADERLVLITGCGRSGTNYICDVLNVAGLQLGHEELGRDGSVSWCRAGGNYYSCYQKVIKAGPERFTHVFHQVRDPINTISSAQTFYPQSWKYISACVPEISVKDPLIVRCAKYWYYWNLLAEDMAEWTYRVEDIDDIFTEMAHRLGVNLNTAALNSIPKNDNTRKDRYKPISWNQLKAQIDSKLYRNIVDLASRYGYETPED